MRTGAATMEQTPSEPNGPGIADRELMGEVRDGDLGRLGELFERHHHRLFNFFLKLTRQRTAAEDLVQEVFVRMLKYRHTYRSDADFTPWMFKDVKRIAKNTAHTA